MTTANQLHLTNLLFDVEVTAEVLSSYVEQGKAEPCLWSHDIRYMKICAVLHDAFVRMTEFRAHCERDASQPEYPSETDPGPSQEQRL